jgi:pimeloyl-ACP methyl ester carboxylesterase
VLAHAESGAGPAVVLVHGMGTGAAAWTATAEALSARARVLLPDRRGYGATPAPEPYGATTVSEQTEDLAALITATGAAPAVVAGADIAALACLDLLLRHRGLVRGAMLVDPPLLALVPAAIDAVAAERVALEEELREGGPRGAMQAWLGHPSDADPRAFFADYAAQATLSVTRRELRAIEEPVTVVTTGRAGAHGREAAAALVELLPRGRTATDATAAVADLLAAPAPPGEGHGGSPPA